MLFQHRLGKDDNGTHEVNLTPLIDVSLVLVVMLLLATPLAFESSIGVRKTAATTRAAKEKRINDRIELSVVSEDMVRINKTLVPMNKIGMTLRPMLRENTDRLVVVNCADAITHGTFVDVLDRIKMSGAAEIAVTGR